MLVKGIPGKGDWSLNENETISQVIFSNEFSTKKVLYFDSNFIDAFS